MSSFNQLLAIIRAELVFNSRRVVFYALVIFFIVNAIAWWQGASIYYGWATNSDFYIARLCSGFTFMTTPFFVAMVMGDAVIRDLRFEMTPLLLSQPVSRGTYLLGKFFGNFFALILCCAAYPLTLVCLQAMQIEGMIVFPFRLAPYGKFYFALVIIPHFALAAFCFLLGTLSRSVRLVYGFIVGLYGLYLPFMMFLEFRAPGWSRLLDPLLFDWANSLARNQPAAVVNQLVISFDAGMMVNRLTLLGIGSLCLLITCWRFKGAEPAGSGKSPVSLGALGLVERSERLYQEVLPMPADSVTITVDARRQIAGSRQSTSGVRGQAQLVHTGWRAWRRSFIIALQTEFKLLRTERSLIALIPFTLLLCLVQLPPYTLSADSATFSGQYAANIADALLLLLFAVAVFYTGEAVARDSETKIEAILWSLPARDSIFLLSKFAALLLLSLSVIALATLASLGFQAYRTTGVPAIYPHFAVCAIILLPGTALMLAVSLLIHVLLRDKYLAYGVSLAIGGGLYYLATQGYNNWLYNPLLLHLWNAGDLYPTAPAFTRIILYRLYWFSITLCGLALAHRFFQRRFS